MDGLRLLATALRAGLRVRVSGNQLIVDGPRRCEPLALTLLEHKAELLPLGCDRCQYVVRRVVEAYWGARYCPACCELVAAEHDRAGTWPPVPWEDETPR